MYPCKFQSLGTRGQISSGCDRVTAVGVSLGRTSFAVEAEKGLSSIRSLEHAKRYRAREMSSARKVTFRKPNAATTCLLLGLKFRESFGKGVFVDKIIPGTEAARLERWQACKHSASGAALGW